MKEENTEIKQLLSKAKAAQMKQFLAEVLAEDEELLLRFRQQVETAEQKTNLPRYLALIDRTVSQHVDRYGYAECEDGSELATSVYLLLKRHIRPLVQSGKQEDAVTLLLHLLETLGETCVDDSYGEMGEAAGEVVSCLEEILNDNENGPLGQHIFRWLSENDGCIDEYGIEDLELMYGNHFKTPDYLQQKLQIVDKKLENLQTKKLDSATDYAMSKCIVQRMQLMQELGATITEAETFARTFAPRSEVLDYLIRDAEQRGDEKDLERLLLEAIQASTRTDSYQSKLMRLYQRQGRQDGYRQLLRQLVLQDPAGNLTNYRELRALYSPEEWQTERQTFLEAQAKRNRYGLAELYNEEELLEPLLQCVLKSDGLGMVELYEKKLKPIYAEQLLAKCVEELKQRAQYANKRKDYQALMQNLRYLGHFRGGKAAAEQLAAQWGMMYHNRRAMMEELAAWEKKYRQ